MLASAGFDSTVRLWDVENRSCLHVLTTHTGAVYSISFSPKGTFFVTGGVDQELLVWRTADAALIADYKASGGIFEAVWNPTGVSIAICLSDSTSAVIPSVKIPRFAE
jgi:transducin (beta)-like 1